jgi:hypothetical protein
MTGIIISLHLILLNFNSVNHQTLPTSLRPVHNLGVTGMSMFATTVVIALRRKLIVSGTAPTILLMTSIRFHCAFSLNVH